MEVVLYQRFLWYAELERDLLGRDINLVLE
jgi:hypothetical protein